ncbi:hypothetical protein NECAME_10213 [Necator americanus]|uniref:Uncharacterized protein n=1 Tax=Necator americanus TaxID=51031 RepID=W2TC87_NECAM|nr:hypothetical protein NECAME_10213 [Necator americanus]ETN78627.1 hypothetical protein NECAME_10213 [Necator americanus]
MNIPDFSPMLEVIKKHWDTAPVAKGGVACLGRTYAEPTFTPSIDSHRSVYKYVMHLRMKGTDTATHYRAGKYVPRGKGLRVPHKTMIEAQ